MLNSPMLEAAGVSSGWLAIAAVGVAVVSYFLGCFNGAVVVSRYILRNDIRQHGSGNAGLTNFYRVFGGPLTAAVILSDALKAVLAVLFATFIAGHISPELVTLAKYWAGAFCIIGHMYPCTFQFRGGKGVLSGSVVAVMIGLGHDGVLPCWIIPVTVWVGFLILVAATRYVSLGSCWGGASFIAVSWLVYRDPLILLLSAVMGGLLLWKHRGNMVRVVKGTESKFAFRKKGAGAPAPAPAVEASPGEDPAEEASIPEEDPAGAQEAHGEEPAAGAPAEGPEEAAGEESAPQERSAAEPPEEAAAPEEDSAGGSAKPAPQDYRPRPRKHRGRNKK